MTPPTRADWRKLPLPSSAHDAIDALLDRCEAAEAERDQARTFAETFHRQFMELSTLAATATEQNNAALDQRDRALAQVQRLRALLSECMNSMQESDLCFEPECGDPRCGRARAAWNAGHAALAEAEGQKP